MGGSGRGDAVRARGKVCLMCELGEDIASSFSAALRAGDECMIVNVQDRSCVRRVTIMRASLVQVVPHEILVCCVVESLLRGLKQ